MGYDTSSSAFVSPISMNQAGGLASIRAESYSEGDYQRGFHAGKNTSHADAGYGCFPDWPFTCGESVHKP